MTDGKPVPAPDRTHHLIDSKPAYSRRFDEVLAFHPPGLAPVRLGDTAWHIHQDGSDAYARRFARTFGFYEGLAGVVSHDGWHHIDAGGDDRYPHRYDWCGNFQGGLCAVRERDGGYLHITPDGGAAYGRRWRYAGDFREGSGVVQGDDGRSTHIRCDGSLLHGCWFVDLDVFHKGFARARDRAGWTHVTAEGIPAYSRRFAAVEPFYNGQARVERLDGGVEIIGEDGGGIVELRAARHTDFHALSGDMVGFWRTQTIAAAVTLGVFERLPGTTSGIAGGCGLDPGRTHRLLRALGELGLVERAGGWELGVKDKVRDMDMDMDTDWDKDRGRDTDRQKHGRRGGRQGMGGERREGEDGDEGLGAGVGADAGWDEIWVATGKGRYLSNDADMTLADAALEYAGPMSDVWKALPQALKANSGWRAPDIFGDVASNDGRVAAHHRMLCSYAKCDYGAVPEAMGLAGDEHVIDAGGGLGALARFLLEAYPGLSLTVFDRPEVIARARLSACPGIEWKAGDLFKPWGVSGDAVVLARVLHDWGDLDAMKILHNARTSLSRGGRLYIVEMVLPEEGFSDALCDLHLLVATGGKERTEEEYRRLLKESGFVLKDVRRVPGIPSILIGVAK